MQITDHKNKIIIDRRQNKRHKSRQLWKEESMEQMRNEINELIEQSKQKAKVLKLERDREVEKKKEKQN